MSSRTSPVVRHLAVAQGLSIAGSSVDLTLTGIVGARIAPTPELATLPFSVIFLAAGLTTFAVSRAIGRFGHRRVFVGVAAAAAVSGCVSAAAIQLGTFWLFCAGTALIGVYQAGSGYYRYLAADSTPEARPRAVATVLAGGLVAAIVGPFALKHLRRGALAGGARLWLIGAVDFLDGLGVGEIAVFEKRERRLAPLGDRVG